MSLDRIVSLANSLVLVQQMVATKKRELEAATAEQRQIETEDLPELMKELGLSSVSLKTGQIVRVKEDLDCGITDRTRKEALEWLVENGYGDLIKTSVVVDFGKEEREAALALCQEVLERVEKIPTLKETVHPSTLKAFLREALEKGTAVPFDIFNLRPFSKAVISNR